MGEPDDQRREAGEVAEQWVPQRRQVAIFATRARNRLGDRGVGTRTSERGDTTDHFDSPA